MKGKFMKYKQNYYRKINHLMNRINLEYNIENKLDIKELKNNLDNNIPRQICSFCNKNYVKYICPKCKIPYCNVDCYKKHNESCTEEFYKNNVIQELKNTKFNEEEKKNFREKLKNYQEKLNLIDENYDQIKKEDNDNISKQKILRYEEILEKMNNDKFNSKYDFTAEDWNGFYDFVKNFQKSDLFQIYKPFWMRESKSLLVFDKEYYDSFSEEDINSLKNLDLNSYYEYIDEDDNEGNNKEEENKEINLDNLNDIDEDNYIKLKGEKVLIDENIINDSIIIRYQKITKINFTKSSPKNIFQIIYISILTVYIYRIFNGLVDDNDIIKDVYNHIIYLCPLLYDKNALIPDTVENSFNIFIEKLKILEKNGNNFEKSKKMILKDIIELLKGNKFFIYESLLRLYDIIHKYSIQVDIEPTDKNKTTAAKYKLIYFMSYLKYQIKEEDINNISNNFIEILNNQKE